MNVPKIICHETEQDGQKLVHIQIERSEPSAFFAGAVGKTYAEALMRAAITLYNRECQEFNRAEHDHEQADKNDYTKSSAERYRAGRKSPVSVITCDMLLDLTMFHSQMKINCEQSLRCIKDSEAMFHDLHMQERAIPFMTEEVR